MDRSFCRLFLFLALLCGSAASQASMRPGGTLHYDLLLTLHPAEHRMSISGTVLVPAGLVRSRELAFGITSAAGPIRWSSTDRRAKVSAARSGSSRNMGASNAAERAGKAGWTVRGGWPVNAPVALRFAYDLATTDPDGFLYVGPEISFGAGGWYPELPGSRATASIRIQAPEGWLPVASGTSGARRRSGDAVRADFVSKIPGELLFAASPPGSRNIAISAELGFVPLKPRPGAGWESGLAGMQRALEGEFGPIPYPHVTVIEVPDAIAAKAGFGAFAAPGAVLARSQLVEQPFNAPAFAHEFSHLWWGNFIELAGKEGDFLLDEGLAQYGSMMAADAMLGRGAGAGYRRRGVPGFNQALYSALGYLEISAAGMDRPLLNLGDDALSYWIAYSKAGLAWYALAQYVGPGNFRSALKAVVRRHGGGSVSWPAFTTELRRRSPRALDPFLRHWFQETGAPSYALDWQADDGMLRGTIAQGPDAKPAMLEVEIRFTGGAARRTRLYVPVSGAAFQGRVDAPVREVVLDPDYKVLRWTPELREEAMAMSPYMNALVLARTGRAEAAEAALRRWLEDDPRSNAYDRLILAHAKLAALAEARKCQPCAAREIGAALQPEPARPGELVPTYIEMALIARRIGAADLAARAASLAISGDAAVGKANGAAARLGQD